MLRPLVATTVIAAFFAAAPVGAAALDDELDRELRGAWATLAVEVYSSCSGGYTDNTVGSAGVASRADRRFDPGELVKIDKVKVKRKRVDLLITLAEPILVERIDGPFTLYDEHLCRAQLIFELGREVVKSGDAATVLESIGAALQTHTSRASAESSGAWNGRVRRALPDDYDQTLAAHGVWKAEQTNTAVAAAIDRALTRAADATEDMESDDDYLAGFAAGARKLHDLSLGSCESMLGTSFESWDKNPPSDSNASWKRGFDDGQKVVFHVRLARQLHDCYVPVPAAVAP